MDAGDPGHGDGENERWCAGDYAQEREVAFYAIRQPFEKEVHGEPHVIRVIFCLPQKLKRLRGFSIGWPQLREQWPRWIEARSRPVWSWPLG